MLLIPCDNEKTLANEQSEKVSYIDVYIIIITILLTPTYILSFQFEKYGCIIRDNILIGKTYVTYVENEDSNVERMILGSFNEDPDFIGIVVLTNFQKYGDILNYQLFSSTFGCKIMFSIEYPAHSKVLLVNIILRARGFVFIFCEGDTAYVIIVLINVNHCIRIEYLILHPLSQPLLNFNCSSTSSP